MIGPCGKQTVENFFSFVVAGGVFIKNGKIQQHIFIGFLAVGEGFIKFNGTFVIAAKVQIVGKFEDNILVIGIQFVRLIEIFQGLIESAGSSGFQGTFV